MKQTQFDVVYKNTITGLTETANLYSISASKASRSISEKNSAYVVICVYPTQPGPEKYAGSKTKV